MQLLASHVMLILLPRKSSGKIVSRSRTQTGPISELPPFTVHPPSWQPHQAGPNE